MDFSPKARLMRDWVFTEWAEKIGTIMESMADEKPVTACVAYEGDPGMEDDMLWRQNFAAFPNPAIWAVIPKPTCLELGRRTLRAAGIETSEEADEQNTFAEILAQSFSAVGQAMSAHLGTEASATDGEQIVELPDGHEWVEVTIQFLNVPVISAWITCSLEAAERLAGNVKSDGTPAVTTTAAIVESVEKVDATNAGAGSKTFDLLLDVALPVSISFGRTYLPIREVLKLTTGSIVELDRAVSEPVDVIINNCVIARGEVVVIEGNYGVRIRQIASRYDRLRTGSALAQVKPAAAGQQA